MKKRVAKATNPLSDGFKKLLLAHQLKLEAAAKTEVAEANQTNRTFLNQLFVMAGGMITLSSPIFIDRTTLSELGNHSRWALVIAISASTASIGAGFVQLYAERRFFEKSKQAKLGAADKIGRGEVRSLPALRLLNTEARRKSNKSSGFFMWVQILTLAFGAAAFVLVMAHVMLVAAKK